MDITRETKPRRKLNRGVAIGSGAVIILITTLGLARLKPAAPPLDRSTVVTDVVKRGPLTREVRGGGTLVPEDVRWIAAATDARVERVVVQAGTAVGKDTVIVELSDPQQ